MIITREKGMRMWGGGSGSTSASGVNGGGGFSLAVTEGEGTGNAYTDFTYESGTLTLNKGSEFVTVDFFNKLFTAYDANGNVIAPNNTTPTLDNIKFKAGAWTEQYLSALGQNSSGGGGGGGIELSDVWQSLKTNTDDYANQKINAAHIPDLSGTYATKTWVNQQGFVTSSGVTSVAMTVPTGLSVSGTPITSTGTLALTFASGYSIPTTAKQSNWDTAYGWGNHATAGYASASSVTTLQGYFTNGVANTAAKLNTGTTTYTAWGQTYWSSGVPQSISGNMTSVGSITPSANGNALGTTSARFNIYGTAGNFSGNVSITGTLGVTGATTLTGLLTANGGIVVPAAKTIKIGSCTISWDSTNSMLKFDTGIYSTGAVSALGSNSSGGGSGTFDEEAMWTALGTTSTAKVIASSHIPNLSWNKITSNKPTTLSGYGISDAYTKTQVDNALSDYLPLSGGTLTGTLTAPKIRINTRHSSDDTSGGIYYYNGTTDYLLIGQGSANLWIGANETVGTHHTGGTFISAGSGDAAISRLVNGSRENYIILDAGNYSSYALPLTGGTLTGGLTALGYNAKFDVDTSREMGLAWLNTSGTRVASVTYHNTAKNIILNPIGSSDTRSDAVGKYSLFVGNNKLTYNTYPILHSNNYSSYALPLSGGTITGNLAVRGYIYLRDNNKGLYTTDTADNVQNTLYLNNANELLIGYGTAGSGYNTHIYGNNLYLRYGTSRTIGITLSSSGSTTFAGSIVAKANAYNYSTDATSYGLYMNNSDIAGVNAIYTSDTADNWAEGINFKRTNGKWDSIRALNGVFSFGHDNGTEDIKIDVGTRKILIGGTTTATMTYNTTNPRLVFAENGDTQAVGIVYTDFNSYRAGKGLKVMDVDQNDPDVWFEVGGSIYATGDVQASSDERKKDIISNTKFNVKDIASARSILYEWNDGRDSGQVHGGSIAQDWLGKADDFITKDGDGYMSLNYGALALCSAITIAREVVKHEDEITRLKKEVVKLRERVAELEERRIA